MYHPHFVHGLIGKDRKGWVIRLTISWMGHLIFSIIELLLIWNHLLMSIYMGHKYLHIFYPFEEICSHTSSPDILLSPWPSIQLLAITCTSVNNCPSGHFYLQTKCMALLTTWIIINCDDSIHWCISGLSQKGVVMLELSSSGDFHTMCMTISKLGSCLVFFSQPIIRCTPWVHSCILGSIRHFKGIRNCMLGSSSCSLCAF